MGGAWEALLSDAWVFGEGCSEGTGHSEYPCSGGDGRGRWAFVARGRWVGCTREEVGAFDAGLAHLGDLQLAVAAVHAEAGLEGEVVEALPDELVEGHVR